MIIKRLKEKFRTSKKYLKQLVKSARKVTICLDGWTKKGLSSSFFGISACFFVPEMGKVVHIVLQLIEIKHPYTGIMLSKALRKCLRRWGIDVTKVRMIITDNDSNIIKAVQLLNEENEASDSEPELEDEESSTSEDDNEQTENEQEQEDGVTAESDEEENSNENEEMPNLENTIADFEASTEFVRLPCLAHTLQLVVKKCYASHYDTVLTKARYLVGRFRKSAPAIQALIQATGKTLISDHNTRWNSTYYMTV